VNTIVLDSSAALAHILQERGGERVRQLLAAGNASVLMSAVNWCETLTRARKLTRIIDSDRMAAVLPRVQAVAFDRNQAEIAAAYASSNQFLSLGDRACLALAKSHGATAWTADQVWARASVDVSIELIRT
jgi:ribonuclease VapC